METQMRIKKRVFNPYHGECHPVYFMLIFGFMLSERAVTVEIKNVYYNVVPANSAHTADKYLGKLLCSITIHSKLQKYKSHTYLSFPKKN